MTPLGKTKDPDISDIVSATQAVASALRPGQLIDLEPTTYARPTREIILQRLKEKGLHVGDGFFLCFSPERVDPGNEWWHRKNTARVLGGITDKCTELGIAVYEIIERHASALTCNGMTRSARMRAASERRTGDTVQIARDYQHRARTSGFVVQRFWHAEKERVIRKFSAPRSGDRVLDVGCGSGVVANALAGMGAIVTGVDGNPDAIAFAS